MDVVQLIKATGVAVDDDQMAVGATFDPRLGGDRVGPAVRLAGIEEADAIAGVRAVATLNGIPYPPWLEKSGCRWLPSPIVARSWCELRATGSAVTRWFQTLPAGKTVQRGAHVGCAGWPTSTAAVASAATAAAAMALVRIPGRLIRSPGA